MRSLIAIVVLIVGLYLFKVYYYDADTNSAHTSSPQIDVSKRPSADLPVDIYIAKLTNQNNQATSSGTVIPNEQVEIKSELSGRLISLNIREGGYIEKGQLIAKLDDSEYQAQLKKLKFEQELARQTEARQRKLLDINAISKEEYDMAVNKVNTLGADMEFLQVQIEKTSIRAPFGGKMGLKNISEGAYITPAVIISSLVQTNPVKLDFSLPEKYASKIKSGQTLSFSIDGDDQKMSAKVIALDPRVDEDLRTITVRAKAENQSGKLLPGMFVRIEIGLGEEKSIMIPSKCIIPILKGKKVFLMKNGMATEVEIKTSLRTDTEVAVDEGIEVGDSIITSALMSIKPETQVTLRNLIP